MNGVTGLRWGIAGKDKGRKKLLPMISKYALLELAKEASGEELNYLAAKRRAVRYRAVKGRVKRLFAEYTRDKTQLDDFECGN